MNENVAASTARARGLRHLVLAVGIAVLCALCIGLMGCGGPSPTDVTKQAIEAVKAQDTDALAKVYAGGAANISTDMFASTSEGEELADSSDLTDDQQQVVKDFYSKLLDFDYTLSDEQIDGDSATVKVTINTYNFGNALNKVFQDALSTAFMYMFSTDQDAAQNATTQAMIDSLDTQMKSLTDKDKSATATVSLEKQDGNWVVQPFDGDFYNAMTGGAYDLSNNMQKSFGSNS